MVVTRSQAAAARAASQDAARAILQDRQAADVVTAIVEVPDENILATTAPTTVQLVPEAEDRLANLAERFLAQAQALAGEHVMLKYQQEGLNQAQQAALVAVQGYAESWLKELANRQLVMVQEFQGELAPIRSTLQQQTTLLQELQADLWARSEGEFNGKLDQTIQGVQREAQSTLQAHAEGAKELEQSVHTKFDAGFKEVTAHVQQQIEEQLTSRLGPNPSKDVEQLVNKSARAMETRIGTELEHRLDELLASKLDSRNDNERLIDKNVDELVHKLVDTSVSNLEHRLEQSFDLRFKQIQQEMQLQLDSNLPLHETFTEDIQQLVTQETTGLVRQAESRMQEVVNAARADVNLQVQRQADALSILREQLQLRRLRSQEEPSNTDAIENKLTAFVKDEVARQVDLKVVRLPFTGEFGCQQFADLVGIELGRVLDERQRRPSAVNASAATEVKQSVESSIQSIIATVRGAVNHALPQEPLIVHENRTRSSQQADTDEEKDDDLSEEDPRAQRRMREALAHAQSECKAHIKEEQDGCPTSATMEDISSISNTSRENRASTRHRPIRGSVGRSGNYRGRRIGLRGLSVQIQQPVAERAEASAQRYDVRS